MENYEVILYNEDKVNKSIKIGDKYLPLGTRHPNNSFLARVEIYYAKQKTTGFTLTDVLSGDVFVGIIDNKKGQNSDVRYKLEDWLAKRGVSLLSWFNNNYSDYKYYLEFKIGIYDNVYEHSFLGVLGSEFKIDVEAIDPNDGSPDNYIKVMTEGWAGLSNVQVRRNAQPNNDSVGINPNFSLQFGLTYLTRDEWFMLDHLVFTDWIELSPGDKLDRYHYYNFLQLSNSIDGGLKLYNPDNKPLKSFNGKIKVKVCKRGLNSVIYCSKTGTSYSSDEVIYSHENHGFNPTKRLELIDDSPRINWFTPSINREKYRSGKITNYKCTIENICDRSKLSYANIDVTERILSLMQCGFYNDGVDKRNQEIIGDTRIAGYMLYALNDEGEEIVSKIGIGVTTSNVFKIVETYIENGVQKTSISRAGIFTKIDGRYDGAEITIPLEINPYLLKLNPDAQNMVSKVEQVRAGAVIPKSPDTFIVEDDFSLKLDATTTIEEFIENTFDDDGLHYAYYQLDLSKNLSSGEFDLQSIGLAKYYTFKIFTEEPSAWIYFDHDSSLYPRSREINFIPTIDNYQKKAGLNKRSTILSHTGCIYFNGICVYSKGYSETTPAINKTEFTATFQSVIGQVNGYSDNIKSPGKWVFDDYFFDMFLGDRNFEAYHNGELVSATLIIDGTETIKFKFKLNHPYAKDDVVCVFPTHPEIPVVFLL